MYFRTKIKNYIENSNSIVKPYKYFKQLGNNEYTLTDDGITEIKIMFKLSKTIKLSELTNNPSHKTNYNIYKIILPDNNEKLNLSLFNIFNHYNKHNNKIIEWDFNSPIINDVVNPNNILNINNVNYLIPKNIINNPNPQTINKCEKIINKHLYLHTQKQIFKTRNTIFNIINKIHNTPIVFLNDSPISDDLFFTLLNTQNHFKQSSLIINYYDNKDYIIVDNRCNFTI